MTQTFEITEGGIPEKRMEEFGKAFRSGRGNRVASGAAVNCGLSEAAADPERMAQLPYSFSIDLKQGSITNQKSSGRCWLFAALNTFRYETITKFNLEDFELSQNYLFFWDKLEKANYYLENMMALASEPEDGRLFCFLNADPLCDGGQWDMMASLVRKYGVVPKEAYPDGANSVKSRPMNSALCALLRENAVALRGAVKEGISTPVLRSMKEEMLSEIYRVLCICLGEPPKTFDFTVRSKDGQVYQEFGISGREFYDKYVGLPLDEYVSLINAPTSDKPFGQLYTVKYLGNVAEGSPVRYLNLPMDKLRDAAIAQLRDGHPVWFGSDCGQFAVRERALFDRKGAGIEPFLDIRYSFGKRERLTYGESAMNHAMVLLGVNMDRSGRSDRWRIENSWGKESGPNGGYYVASDSWFGEFVYQVAVNRKYLDEESVKLLDGELHELEPWDPMGTLAD